MRNKSYKVLYDSKISPDFFKVYLEKKGEENPEISIRDIKFIGRILSFEVFNYKISKAESKNIGKVEVHIKIIDEKNKTIFDNKKIVKLPKKAGKLSIKFKQLRKGNYYILMNIKDMLTDKVARDQKRVSVD